MNRVKFFAYISIAAMLFACGSQDKGGPPELDGQVLLPISPFDTLVVKFDTKIDKDKLGDSNIVAENAVLVPLSENTKELKFVGKNTSPGNSKYFDSNLSNDIIEFKNLYNTDGYRQESTILRYSTIQILDDITGKNDSRDSAIDLTPFFGTSKRIEFTGVLDHKIGASKFNMEDYYKISLRMNDTLKIEATSRDTLTIEITEPNKNSMNETIDVKKETVKKEYVIGGGHLDIDKDPANKMGDFYIKVFDNITSKPPNPYTLSISVLR